MSLIEVENLVKDFKVIKKKKGFKGAISGLFNAEKYIVKAVDDVSFNIESGEIVGYIGPNGAGKSTTIKMMCGILEPTSGTIKINGISPQKDRKTVVKMLGVVFGQRTQLYWDLRLGESFELLKRIYKIDNDLYEQNIKKLDEVLGINKLIDVPVRQLSLGQRMRGDLAASILHSPPILFLDEPTIGLDIEAKHSVRQFIKEINQKFNTTIILTTHDLDDLQQLCERVIIINHGKIIEDGPIGSIIEKIAPYRYLIVDFENEQEEINHPLAEIVKKDKARVWIRFEKKQTTAAQLISDLSKVYSIKDLSVTEPDIEDVVRQIYKAEI